MYISYCKRVLAKIDCLSTVKAVLATCKIMSVNTTESNVKQNLHQVSHFASACNSVYMNSGKSDK